MSKYQDSDYAVNKFSKGIVYRFSNETIEITLEAYLRDNPGKTKADFTALKALSDEIYYEQDRADSAQTRKDISIHGLETQSCAPGLWMRNGWSSSSKSRTANMPDKLCAGCYNRAYLPMFSGGAFFFMCFRDSPPGR